MLPGALVGVSGRERIRRSGLCDHMVGPEHFGIVSIDCAKARCINWMLCDFYGNVLIPPTIVALNHAKARVLSPYSDRL